MSSTTESKFFNVEIITETTYKCCSISCVTLSTENIKVPLIGDEIKDAESTSLVLEEAEQYQKDYNKKGGCFSRWIVKKEIKSVNKSIIVQTPQL